MRWHVRQNMCDRDSVYQGIRDAIIEDKVEAVNLLCKPNYGVQLDHQLFKLAVLTSGCNTAIIKLCAYASCDLYSLIGRTR